MMKAVIVAKTRMGSGACVGALTFEGRSLRLVAADRKTNDQFNMGYQVGEVWEIETCPDPEIIPPHVENVIVTGKRRLGPITQMEAFVAQQMPAISGGVERIFNGLTQTTNKGALYIAERTGLPERSTLFWCPDKALKREDDQKRIRYRYPTPEGGATLTFTGFQEPIPELPAGALLRVSLAHWWRPEEMEDGEYRCYVQLSGWFLPETNYSTPSPDASIQGQRDTFEDMAPEIDQVLQQVFGYPDFRPLQAEIIRNLLSKRDTLAVMPTGSGKSLCYQLPATLYPGLTVVVSPLIALMEDQVLELREWGVPAVYLNSTLTHSEYLETTARLRAGEIKLLYAAPETLLRPESTLLLEDCRVNCLVIDEAHCISEWGHDFRPEYRQLEGLRTRLPGAVTLAVTATATRRVRQDIKRSLGITDANEFISSFDRENLVLSVTDKITALDQTRTFLDAHREQAGIIYCSTRDHVDVLSSKLQSLGYPVLPYHAGMEAGDRRDHQYRFRYEDGVIMVATIAFGMGINKSNLRFILHYDLPKNIESYYQQIGRAGRDGLPADCLLLFSYSDIHTIRYFIRQEPKNLRKGSEMRLKALLSFLDTRTCRRSPLLNYFGEAYHGDGCGACDNCLSTQAAVSQASREIDQTSANEVELTTPARQLFSCAHETGEIFGADHLIKILRGSRAKKVLKFGHEKLSWHGAGRDYSKDQWRHLAAQFIRQGLLERTRPHGSLKVTEAGKTVLEGGEVWGSLPGTLGRAARREAPEHDPVLFEKLRALRTHLARERGLPPYIILQDRSLIEMAAYFPRVPAELLQIYGIGQHKASEYGPHFLPIIKAYCQENQINPSPRPLQRPVGRSGSGQKRTENVWECHQAGDTIEKTARDFGLKPRTILNHLKKAYQAGKQLRVEVLQESSQLSPEDEVRIISAFEEHGDTYLRPVFDALDERIGFDQLHLWRLIYQVMAAGK